MSVNPQLSFRVPQEVYDRLERHWRFATRDRNISDTARRALEIGLAELERRTAEPPAQE